jgi:hypothetical protein
MQFVPVSLDGGPELGQVATKVRPGRVVCHQLADLLSDHDQRRQRVSVAVWGKVLSGS